MKPVLSTIGAVVTGFLIGLGLPNFRDRPVVTGDKISPTKSAEREQTRPTDRLLKLANEATSLTPSQWPAFFQARMNHPDGTRLAERLWAEQDPAGFWKWLIARRDLETLKAYGANLLRIWSETDPDAAMQAANAITDKSASDYLRREVIESVLDRDLQKGLSLAAQALDFNRFSWGPRGWMTRDPGGAVRGLAALPAQSEYRDYLNHAVEEWAKQDTPSLLSWLKTQPAPEKEDWYEIAFKSAATSDIQAALDAANHMDPASRGAAITGVLSSGKIPTKDVIAALPFLTLDQQAKAATDAIQITPLRTPEQFTEATQLLLAAPANQNTFNSVERIAGKFENWDEGLRWAGSLPDSALRRRALESVAFQADLEQLDRFAGTVSTVSLLDLSTQTFRTILRKLPLEKRDAWIARLPAERAAWARAAAAEEQ